MALCATTLLATAQSLPSGAVSNVSVERTESKLLVKMSVNPSVFPTRANREIWLRPVVTDGQDSIWLKPLLIAGRTRYYQHMRHDGNHPQYIMMRSGKGDIYCYSAMVAYADWMELSTLKIISQTDGCCGEAEGESSEKGLASLDFRPKVFKPVLVYVKPEGEVVKTREIHGSAYIDFRINSTDISPEYHRNPQELAKIRSTIEAVRSDKDVTITSLSIKGFASPEGPYKNNERLAKGRTEALTTYVSELYSFPLSVMHTSWEAEDWEGLIKWVRSHNLADKEGILKIITDESLDPDKREWRLKTSFPDQYEVLLNEVYPSLRHSDYAVNYTIRHYTNVKEIAAIMATAPQKLSLEELFMLAQSLDKDSPDFREVMEVAVRMYPDSEVANLNAANTAIAHGESEKSREYLKKAGKSPEAVYALGILEATTGNYDSAFPLLQAAAEEGVAEARDAIVRLRELGFISK